MRRSLSVAEFELLIETATTTGRVRGLSGADRGVLYVLAAYTGYRRNELGSLTTRSFNFAATPPQVTVEAGYSKRKQLDVIPLRSDVAEQLQKWLQEKSDLKANERLFKVTDRRTAEILRCDLEAARKQWIKDAANDVERERREASSFLAHVNEHKQVVDFHSLRMTFITNLSRGNVSPKLAQTLARHSDINLTMNTYTTLGMADQSNAIDSLPPVPNLGRSMPNLPGRNPNQELVPLLVPAADLHSHAASSHDNPARSMNPQPSGEGHAKNLSEKERPGVCCHVPGRSVSRSTEGGSRTHTPFRTLDFESSASAIPPLRRVDRSGGDSRRCAYRRRALEHDNTV